MPPVTNTLPVLTTHNLSVGYAAPRKTPIVILDKVNVELIAGELVCLIGPNGAGKSTLMRTLAGMQPPIEGYIHLAGQDLKTLTPRNLARQLSIVLTEPIDVGTLSAYTLVALGRYPYTGWLGELRAGDKVVVEQAIKAVDAQDLAERNISELSDGERQKIMIARALAQEPAVMLLDEPTAHLDLPRRADLMTMLRKLARESNRAILLSTHDLDLALHHADRVWLLPKGGPLHVGAPEDLVLSGAFEAAFRSEGVTFDAYSGSFKSNPPPAGVVNLVGDGLPFLWTQRALEREGFCIAANDHDAAFTVSITRLGDKTQWYVRLQETTQACTTLYELVSLLKKLNAKT